MSIINQGLVDRLEVLAKASMDGYWALDQSGKIIFANAIISSMYGYSSEELIGKHLRDFEVDEDESVMQVHMAQIISNGYDRFETRHRRQDNSVFDVEVSTVFNREDGIFIAFTRDISERKNNELALKTSELKYRRLYETIIDAFAVVDMQGNLKEWNRPFEHILGYSTLELADRNYVGITPEKWHSIERRIIQEEVIPNGYSAVYEKEYIRKDGTVIPVELRTYLIQDETGEATGMWAFIRDISSRKQAELRLKKSEQEFRLTFEDASDAIFWADADTGMLINCNKAAEEMMELPRREIIGKHQTFLHPTEMADHFSELFRRTTATHDQVDNAEAIVVSNSGKKILVHIKHSVTSIDGRNIMQGVFRDVTAQKQAEEMLWNEKALLRSVIDSTSDLIYFKNCEGIYIGCNKASERFIGLAEHEQIGKSDFDLIDHEIAEKSRKHDRMVMEGGISVRYEEWVNSPIDGRLLLDTVKAPIYGSDGQPIALVGISRNITDRKKAEEEKLALEQQLQQAQKLESLGVLAGGIAHDFNNILTGIIGNISFARKFLDNNHKSAVILQKAETAANRASALSNQLLTFAKGGQPVKQVVSVKHMLEESVSFILSGSTISYRSELPDDILPIEVDEGQFSQVLHNIIINATQAMPGGGTIIICAENSTVAADNSMSLAPGKYVRLTVSDSGCGIAKEDQQKIFDPYFTTKADGSGLGLATTHSIIMKHGGHIEVNSVFGEGTTVEILLPACENKSVHVGIEPSAEDSTVQIDTTVLVMDDEEIIRDLTSIMLQDSGYCVQTCVNGDEAITLYRAAVEAGKRYSAVVMDLTVPGGMGGREAAHHILALDPKARLIVSSGYSSDPVMANYSTYGFSAVLQKPYDADDLTSVLRTVLRTCSENRCR